MAKEKKAKQKIKDESKESLDDSDEWSKANGLKDEDFLEDEEEPVILE